MTLVFRRFAVVALGILALSSCARTPVLSDKVRISPPGRQETQPEPVNQDMLQRFPALDNAALQAFVNEIGQRLAKPRQKPGQPWRVTVVDSPEVNAFALPGGYIFVTRGILAYLDSETELAAVIGHEMAYLTLFGGRQQGVSHPSGSVSDSIQGPNPDRQADSTKLQSLAQDWVRAGSSAAVPKVDQLNAAYLAKAGYPPQAMMGVMNVLNNLSQFAEQTQRDSRLSLPDRIASAAKPGRDARRKQVAHDARLSRAAQARDGRGEYLQHLAGVTFGANPEQGLIRNNVLLYPRLGLAFQFPQGWLVQHEAGRMLAINPRRDAQIELQPGLNSERPLDVLQYRLNLDPGARYENGTLNGHPAVFAAGAQHGKPVVAAAVMLNGTLQLIIGLTQDKSAYARERDTLRRAINSFHAITPIELSAARPYVLKVITVQPGMTMAYLARVSPLGAEAEARLRLMNNLYPHGEPQPGQLLKIVH